MSESRDPRRLIQLDLFRARPAIPQWARLPDDVQRKTLGLLARMLSGHRQARDAADHGREAGDE
jgi:hypothetical protein